MSDDTISMDFICGTAWTRDEWEQRKEMAADVWHRRSTEEQKRLLALLIAHAPEAAGYTCQNE